MITNKSYPLSNNTIEKIRNEFYIDPNNIAENIASFRKIKRKDQKKTIKNALQSIVFGSSEKPYQKEIFDLFTDYANSKNKSIVKIKTNAILNNKVISNELEWEGHNFRFIVKPDGDMDFLANDICHCLGLTQVAQAISKLDNDEKFVDSNGRKMVTEPGMYKLIMRSNTAAGGRFRRWICHKILPTIRKTGGYIRSDATPEELEKLQNKVADMQKLLKSKDNRIFYLENNPRNDCDRLPTKIIDNVNKKITRGQKDWNIDKEHKLILSEIRIRTGSQVTIKQILNDPALAAEAIDIIENAA